MKNIPNLFILSGPSGVGEDSVIEKLSDILSIERVITTTTRDPRTGESQGNPYYFISKKDFEQKIQNGEMIEYAKEYNDHYYGVTTEEIHRVSHLPKIGIWKIEYKGVITAKKLFPNIIAILLSVKDISILEDRIKRRQKVVDEDYIKERMAYTREWLKHTDIYDYIVYNEENQLEKTVREVSNIIQKHAGVSKDYPVNRS